MTAASPRRTSRPTLPIAAGMLALCRTGFERDCAQELQNWLGAQGANGYCQFEKLSGLVIWLGESERWPQTQELIFARQAIPLLQAMPLDMGGYDRISPILGALDGLEVSALYLDHPDSNDGRSMTDLFQKLQKPLLSAAGKASILNREAPLRAHLVFESGSRVWLGMSSAGQTLRWPMGIPRLKMPTDAPSRSTLKLAEAFAYFMSPEEQSEWLREGLTAVDLGACPGGWTYQLIKHGLQVTAIDNGQMSEVVMRSDLVEHVEADGFIWRPKRPVHWLVCDMIEKPERVAQLIAQWLADGDAKRAIFNLKLPMKTRLEEVEHCREVMETVMAGAGKSFKQLSFRQLYHDREEVTGFAVS